MNDAKYASNGLKYRLLVIDDEPSVIGALERCLVREGYEIDSFTDPVAALEQARHAQYDLVLSDYLMPELDGVMLLGLIRQIQPQTKRIILSACTDKYALIEAINQAQIDRIIIKPWEASKLRFEISKALSAEPMSI